jgi:cytochrome c oxidase subunit 3
MGNHLPLGLVFAFLQWQGWIGLYQSGAALINNNAAISLIYVVSGFHLLLHIIAGIMLYLLIALWALIIDIPCR